MELAICPEGGRLAEVEWRDRVPAEGEDIELVKVRCLGRHWFAMPADRMETLPEPVARRQRIR